MHFNKRDFSFPDLNPSEDLVEDMWLGVSVASQGYPGGRVLVSSSLHLWVWLHMLASQLLANPSLILVQPFAS